MGTIRRSSAVIAGAAMALLVATAVAADPGGDRHARGTFVDVNGDPIGHLRLSQGRDGDVRVVVTVQGLTPGLHGIHIHAVDADGHGHLNAATDRVTLTDGPASLFDLDGSALIIHANPDDQVTNVGNGGSGARIACAVVEQD